MIAKFVLNHHLLFLLRPSFHVVIGLVVVVGIVVQLQGIRVENSRMEYKFLVLLMRMGKSIRNHREMIQFEIVG